MLLPLLPTRIHGILDYVGALLFIAMPWTNGFSQYTWAPWIMFMIGIGVIIYSVFTRYECGYAGLISMQTHLWLDIVSGLILIVSPWVFGFSNHVYEPHVITGSVVIGIALITRTKPSHSHGPVLTPPSRKARMKVKY
jgi:hypothetical protein